MIHRGLRDIPGSRASGLLTAIGYWLAIAMRSRRFAAPKCWLLNYRRSISIGLYAVERKSTRSVSAAALFEDRRRHFARWFRLP